MKAKWRQLGKPYWKQWCWPSNVMKHFSIRGIINMLETGPNLMGVFCSLVQLREHERRFSGVLSHVNAVDKLSDQRAQGKPAVIRQRGGQRAGLLCCTRRTVGILPLWLCRYQDDVCSQRDVFDNLCFPHPHPWLTGCQLRTKNWMFCCYECRHG